MVGVNLMNICGECGNEVDSSWVFCARCGKQRLSGTVPIPEKRVPQMLRELARIHDERGTIYGDNYKHGGLALLAMFPKGIVLETEEEFNRFHLLVYLYGKLSRYARTVKTGGHVDSLDDLAVYAMLLQEYDEELRG